MRLKSVFTAPLLLLIVTGLLLFSHLLKEKSATSDTTALIVFILIQIFAFLVPALIYMRLRPEDETVSWRISFLSTKHWWLSFVTGVCCLFVSLVMGVWLFQLDSSAFEKSAIINDALFVADDSLGSLFRMIFVYGLLPAVCQECLFHGAILREYEKYGILLSVLLSSLSYALLQFQPYRFFISLLVGIFLSFLAYATDSLWTAAVAGFICRLGQIILEKYICNFISTAQNGSVLLLFFMILLTLAFLILYLAGVERCFKEKSMKENEYPRKTQFSFLQSIMAIGISIPFVAWMISAVVISLTIG